MTQMLKRRHEQEMVDCISRKQICQEGPYNGGDGQCNQSKGTQVSEVIAAGEVRHAPEHAEDSLFCD